MERYVLTSRHVLAGTSSDEVHGGRANLVFVSKCVVRRIHGKHALIVIDDKIHFMFFPTQNQADETFPSKFQPRNSDVIFMSSRHDALGSNLFVVTCGDGFLAYRPPRLVN
jgi:hypothetical protein